MFDTTESDGTPTLLRLAQEREVQLDHALASAEYALAREAFEVGQTFVLAGIPFDAATFVAMRVLDASAAESVDPLECLRTLGDLGTLDRSVEIAHGLLEEAA